MKESGYYPPGAEFDPNAPYNEKELPPKEIEVTVSITLSKTVTIEVSDYAVYEEEDEDGKFLAYDFSECDLKSAISEQIDLPGDDSWNIDDFEAFIE